MSLELFSAQAQGNILPFDGEVLDFGQWLSPQEANAYFQYFLTQLPWQHDQAKLYGKHYITARQVAWYGDANYDYRYSGVQRKALMWDAELRKLKQRIEAELGERFNSCLANLYHNGTQGMAWHSDADVSLATETVIASMSLGESRRFLFRHIHTKQQVEVHLQSGQLLVMRGVCQQYWQHSLPKALRVTEPRINLTFRQFIGR